MGQRTSALADQLKALQSGKIKTLSAGKMGDGHGGGGGFGGRAGLGAPGL